MQINSRIVIPIAVAVGVLGAAGATWAVVESRSDQESVARGTCANASYVLSAEPEDSGIEVSLELQSAVPGETWQVDLAYNGSSLISGQRTTDEDAEIDVDAYVDDAADAHEFVARFSTVDGEPCMATVRL